MYAHGASSEQRNLFKAYRGHPNRKLLWKDNLGTTLIPNSDDIAKSQMRWRLPGGDSTGCPEN